MVTPPPPRSSSRKWFWVAAIVVLAFVLVVVLLNPTGDRDGDVEDPIVMPDTGEGVGVGQDPAPNDTSPPPEPFAPGGDLEG